MATEAQYLFFKSMYEEENSRSKILADHGKTNLSLVTLYTAFALYPSKDLSYHSVVDKYTFYAGFLFLFLSFFTTLMAMNIARFEAAAVPSEIFASFGSEPPLDKDFYDDRIVDYAVSYEKNSAVNDRKANFLLFSRYFLLSGIVFHAGYVLLNGCC